MTPLEIAEHYFELSNKSDFAAIGKLFDERSTFAPLKMTSILVARILWQCNKLIIAHTKNGRGLKMVIENFSQLISCG